MWARDSDAGDNRPVLARGDAFATATEWKVATKRRLSKADAGRTDSARRARCLALLPRENGELTGRRSASPGHAPQLLRPPPGGLLVRPPPEGLPVLLGQPPCPLLPPPLLPPWRPPPFPPLDFAMICSLYVIGWLNNTDVS